ncbi:MAG TPA: oligopeptide ABC transporter permease OppB [Candidatus Sulfotelmatobacter sp.]|nr:oligopeptide ABC transporter permease OppB [Candidatus Sulfotelmatobacter sp.]
MLTLGVRRLIGAIPTLLAIVAVSFFLMRLAPGGPFDQERVLPPAIEANLRQAYRLDDPLPTQFVRYLGGLLHGDFGPSFKYQDFSVTELIGDGLPVSLTLGLGAIVIASVAGVWIGLAAALRRNSRFDHLVMTLAMTGIVVPSFVVAPLLGLVFGIYLRLLPVGGWRGPLNAVLPIVTLALPQIAAIARLARASAIETLGQPFVRTARAKGLPERRVMLRHVLKPALLPVLSYLGPATAGILTGSVVVEQIFGIPGIGRYFVQGALNRDYTLVMGVVILYATLIILFNLAVDLLYRVLDPKQRTP